MIERIIFLLNLLNTFKIMALMFAENGTFSTNFLKIDNADDFQWFLM